MNPERALRYAMHFWKTLGAFGVNADERGLKTSRFIGVHLRLSAAQYGFEQPAEGTPGASRGCGGLFSKLLEISGGVFVAACSRGLCK